MKKIVVAKNPHIHSCVTSVMVLVCVLLRPSLWDQFVNCNPAIINRFAHLVEAPAPPCTAIILLEILLLVLVLLSSMNYSIVIQGHSDPSAKSPVTTDVIVYGAVHGDVAVRVIVTSAVADVAAEVVDIAAAAHSTSNILVPVIGAI